jgi:hypothetical protein
VPAERADYPWLLAVDYRDVVAQVGTETHMVATVQKELPTREHPFEYVPERLRFAVSPFLFLGHVVLQKHEAPAGTNTDRDSEFVDCGIVGKFNRK